MRASASGSHSGTLWWLAQRISALLILAAGCVLLAGFWRAAPFDFPAWQAAFQNTAIQFLVWLLVASLGLHAWIGMRDVLIDYVKPLALRLTLNVLVLLTLALCLGWTTVVLWGARG